jgi:ectoine hydroxylase-related dioxygenase (phytanoyl-CoA dioxygenase family)
VHGVTNLGMLPNHESAWCEWLLEPRLQRLLGDKLGDDYRVSHCSSLVNNPGCDRGYLHADWPYNGTNGSRIQPPYPDVLLAISSLWFLTDFSAHSGSTVVVPRSHRTLDNPADGHLKPSGVDPDRPQPGEVHVSGPAGSVLLWDSRLWHRVSDRWFGFDPSNPFLHCIHACGIDWAPAH